jgi:predicted house-cleaning noncanonical NTP pyrophosphatase (MazG superfamily)
MTKLVRDKIPELFKDAKYERVNNDDEFFEYLLEKLDEETAEAIESQENQINDKRLLEELADIYEVIGAILKLKGYSFSILKKEAREKRKTRGAFDLRLKIVPHVIYKNIHVPPLSDKGYYDLLK